MKDGIEMFVCSWMMSLAIILWDEKQSKPTLTTDQSGIKGKHFFWGLDNWQPFLLSTQFLSTIRQLCKVGMCCLSFPDEPVSKQKSFTQQEGPNEPTDELVSQYVPTKLMSVKVTWLQVLTICISYAAHGLDPHVSVKNICLKSNPGMAVASMQRVFSHNEDQWFPPTFVYFVF